MNGDGTGRPEEPQRTHRSRTTGAALEAHYWFMLRLAPALERLPRSQKFLLGDRIEGTALEVLESLIEMGAALLGRPVCSISGMS